MKKYFILSFLSLIFQVASSQIVSGLIEQGITLYDQGKYSEAMLQYKQAYQLDSNNVALACEMAMTYLALEDFATTEALCKKTIEKFSGNDLLSNIYTTYGTCLDNMKKPEEAVKIYEEGIRQFPNYALLYFNKGITEFDLNRMYNARTSFQNSIRNNPQHPSSYYQLGFVEQKMGNRIPEILAFSRFLVLEPNSERAAKVSPYLMNKVNNMYYKKAMANGGIATYSSATSRMDTTENTFQAIEQGLSMIAIFSSIGGSKEEKSTEIEKFEIKMQTIFELLKSSKNKYSGFYWDFFFPYFIELEKEKQVKAFSYYINASADDKSIAKWLKKNKSLIEEFENWSKKHKWD